MERLEANEEAAQMLGKPISTGSPMGSFQVSGPRGNASLSFIASGPKGSGTVFVEATKSLGQWQIDRLVLEQDGSEHRIDLNQ